MRVPPVILLALCIALAAVIGFYFPLFTFRFPIWLVLTFGLAGLAFIILATTTFSIQKTTVNPLSPRETTVLVRHGVFSISRNPMYVGMLLILIAFVMWFEDLACLIVVPVFFLFIDLMQIPFEENSLTEKFGEEYLNYISSVPKWLGFTGGIIKNG